MTTPPLPPMPPNKGVMNYPLFEPITDILDAIRRWEKENKTSTKDVDYSKRVA